MKEYRVFVVMSFRWDGEPQESRAKVIVTAKSVGHAEQLAVMAEKERLGLTSLHRVKVLRVEVY